MMKASKNSILHARFGVSGVRKLRRAKGGRTYRGGRLPLERKHARAFLRKRYGTKKKAAPDTVMSVLQRVSNAMVPEQPKPDRRAKRKERNFFQRLFGLGKGHRDG